MKVKFWGVRGSLPSPLTPAQLEEHLVAALWEANGRRFDSEAEVVRFVQSLPEAIRTTAGGNTPCVEVTNDADDLLILDAGSGIRGLGNQLLKGVFGHGGGRAHVLFSHTHWDHIHGFPFFGPAYVVGNSIRLAGCHDDLEERLRAQHDDRHFPVPFDALGATVSFKQLESTNALCNRRVCVRTIALNHPGGSYAYRIETDNKSLVYATDSTYKRLDPASMTQYVEFFREADLLIFDAMFTMMESIEKADWGHSSAVVGVELATHAQVKSLALFHHDPESDDAKTVELLERAQQYQNILPAKHRCEVLLAREGLELQL